MKKLTLETRIKLTRFWMQFKDFLLVIFLLNCLINYLQGINILDSRETDELLGSKMVVIQNPGIVKAAPTESEPLPRKEETSIHYSLGEFTAYSPEVAQTDSNPEIMASGKKIYPGALACPAKYEFGTIINVEGYGDYTCEDRMAERFRDGDYFDMLLLSREEAIKFGRKQLKFYVSEKL